MAAATLPTYKWTELADSLVQYRPRRTQRYIAVNVLLLYWKDADIPSAKDARDLKRLFCEHFNYRVHSYEIPSSDRAESLLTMHLSRFLTEYGGPDHLVLLHYGGHGENSDEQLRCIWASHRDGGHSLNWALIQPVLLTAQCDVALFVDCCCAGQAARPHLSQSVEFLAAANKDQWAPTGSSRWPSFTQVLIQEAVQCLKTEGVVTLTNLQTRMVRQEANLRIQPFYVPLSKGAAGKIQLRPWIAMPGLDKSQTQPVSDAFRRALTCQIELTMHRPPDSTSLTALLRWLTKDSPTAIKDIRVARRSLEEADVIEKIGEQLVSRNEVQGLGISGRTLSSQGEKEVSKLLQQLRDVIEEPAPENLSDDEAAGIIERIKARSSTLAIFIEDAITHLKQESLQQFEVWNIEEMVDLKSRVSLRLKLLKERIDIQSSSVSFYDHSYRKQRFRLGRQDDVDVLVEYHDYDTTIIENEDVLTKQVSRVAALHLEPKPQAFRLLLGRGYLHETLHGTRYGFIFHVPEECAGKDMVPLSELIKQGKTVPLDVRLNIAAILCEALLCLHSVDWLHKGLKSENVLLFSKQNASDVELPHDEYDFKNPYLFGFDVSRPQDAETRLSVSFSTQENLYRHPERWGNPTPFQRYHDLYALGLLLVEIGRWKLLSDIRIDSKGTKPKSVKKPETLRDFLIGSNYAHLAHLTGTNYAEATKVCLERRGWAGLEDWEYQKVVRSEVLMRLKKCL